MAEAALPMVPVAVRAFVARHRCYARLLRHCDMQSVAEMAVVEASFTYDPSRSKPTTYYGTAIRHALLKEVRRAQRSKEGANERIDLAKALGMEFSKDRRQQALECLRLLPPAERELIEAHVLEGRSLISLARARGRDWRTIKSRILEACESLRLCLADRPCTHADSRDDGPQEPA